jgi:hypothetical protein
MGGVVVQRGSLSVEADSSVAAAPRRLRAGARGFAAVALSALVVVVHVWLLEAPPPRVGHPPSGRQASGSTSPFIVVAPAAPEAGPSVDGHAAASQKAAAALPRWQHRVAGHAPQLPQRDASPRAAARTAARPDATLAGPSASPAPDAVGAPGDAPRVAALQLASPASAPPLYPTAPPPSRTLNYRWQRGAASGLARLDWRPQDDRYELELVALTGDEPAWQQTSRGVLDATGLVPERFVDQRRKRGAQAANFRHDQGRITYSSSAAEQPLPRAAQDRLSWLVQLAAIAQAADGTLEAGSKREVFVSGVRADAGLWTFEVVGADAVATSDGTVPALRLQRHAARPYDTQATVWLAPALHHLPVRVVLQHPPGLDRLELQWLP